MGRSREGSTNSWSESISACGFQILTEAISGRISCAPFSESQGSLWRNGRDSDGLDVYDPTSGEIRSSSTDDIACWFVGSDYNEESFSDEPYKKLQRALKAEIDEDAWASLYSTVSRPFEASATGKIAVKVISHYRDEVLRVYECRAATEDPR